MDSRPLKREFDGGDEEDGGGGQTGKSRRRNVEKHLAAERERRKNVKEKLQVLKLSGLSFFSLQQKKYLCHIEFIFIMA
jgi:hypothetical protein